MPQQISRSESFRLTPDSTWALFNPPKWARTLERTSSIECVSHELLALIIKPMSSPGGTSAESAAAKESSRSASSHQAKK
ncbi:hypothetical protein WME75_22460 [Sorangium sp. So ce1014]|uniref:hypothetical protein n=1 Tax=Sorangium sp. So ce1014 TaxID=3133326 RepID=UPI003F6393EE